MLLAALLALRAEGAALGVLEASALAGPPEPGWPADGPLPGPGAPGGAWRRRVSRLEGELGALRGLPQPAEPLEAPGPAVQAASQALWAEALLSGRAGGPPWDAAPPPGAPGPYGEGGLPAVGDLPAAWGPSRPGAAVPHAAGFLDVGVAARSSPVPQSAEAAIPDAIRDFNRDDALALVFTTISTIFVAFCLYQAVRSYINYRTYKSKAVDCTHGQRGGRRVTNIWTYNVYHLSDWFVTFPGAKGIVIFGIFVFLLLLGSVLYYTIEGERLSIALHKVVAWLVSPDSGATEKSHHGIRMGVFFSISGVLLFALMLSMVQETFTNFVGDIEEGHSDMVAADHTVVIAFDYLNTQTIPLVQQLCYAFEAVPEGETIAVLTSSPKVESEKHIRRSVKLKNSRLVVRHGTPDDKDALKSVAAQFAKRVIITVNGTLSREQRDAYTMQALISLKSHDWPARGEILLLTSLPRHELTLQTVGGPNTHILCLDHVVGNIVVLCSEFSGLCAVIDLMIGFDGSEFYAVDVPEPMVGKTFREASLYYPQCILAGCGTNAKGDPELCNDPQQRLATGEKLLLIAENSNSLAPHEQPVNSGDADHQLGQRCGTRRRSVDEDLPGSPHHHQSSGLAHVFSSNKETILFVGWSRMVGLMLVKLDRAVPRGSKVVSFHSTPVDERKKKVEEAQLRYETKLENITVEYVQGALCSKRAIDDLKHQIGSNFWNDVGRVFIVCEHTPSEAWQDDASTMATAVLLRTSLTEQIPDRSQHPPIVVELHSEQSRTMATAQGFENYVLTSTIPSQVLASVARQPLLKTVLRNLFSNRGHPVQVMSLKNYVDPPEEQLQLSFFQLQSIISNSHDILIGWSKPQPLEAPMGYSPRGYTDDDAEYEEGWEFNPAHKQSARPWNVAKDKMIVISGHSSIDHAQHHHESH